MPRVRRRTARAERDTGPTPEQRLEWHRTAMFHRACEAYTAAGRADLSYALGMARQRGDEAEVDRLSDPRSWAFWREGVPLPAPASARARRSVRDA